MRKNLLALSIAAMVGGLSGVANAAVTLPTAGGIDLVSFKSNDPAAVAVVGYAPGTGAQASDKVKNLGIFVPPAATQLTPTTTGVGHILLVPYFTTQNQNHSLLNIVNTDLVNGKAVKLRYRGAANSDDLFDITIYLSPGDVWAADVAVDGEGFSRLETSDNSCTLPSKAEIKEAFNGRFKTNRVNAGDKNQTREGYIEVLNTADIPPRLGMLVNGVQPVNPLFTAIKHVSGVAPCTQAVMDLQATPLSNVVGDPNTPVARGYSWPTGGLMANWSIVDVSKTATFSGEATALRATPGNVIDQNGVGNLVWAPQTSDVVATANAGLLTADPLLTAKAVTAAGVAVVIPSVKPASYDFPDLSTPYTTAAANPEAQANDLAGRLQTRSVTNEYLTSKDVGFATDWVFSMPTRRYATAVDYIGKRALFNAGVNAHFTSNNVTLNAEKMQLCVDAGNQRGFDREESTRTSFVISPDSVLSFCGETSVLTFNPSNGVVPALGAKIAQKDIETKFNDGWFTVNTNALGNGLPVIGYAASKAGGNIGGTWMHRTQP